MQSYRKTACKAIPVAVGVLLSALVATTGSVNASTGDAVDAAASSQVKAGPSFRCPTKSVSRDFYSTHVFLNPEVGTYGVGYRAGFSGVVCTRGSDVVRFRLDPIRVSYEDSVISRITGESSKVTRKEIKQSTFGKAAKIHSEHVLNVETGLPEICVPIPGVGEACTPAISDKIRLTWLLETRVSYIQRLNQVQVLHWVTLV